MSFFTEKDAKLLIALKNNDFFTQQTALLDFYAENYLPLHTLNSTLSAFIHLQLVSNKEGLLTITDKGKLIVLGGEYLSEKDHAFHVLEKLSELSVEKNLTVEEVVSKKDFDIISKTVKKIKNKSSTDGNIFTVKNIVSFLCYAVVIFFSGFTIGNFIGKNNWGGVFLLPVVVALSVLFYLLTFQEIKQKDAPVDLVAELKKPTLIAIVINGAMALFSIVAFLVLDARYFITLILEVVVLLLIFIKTSKYSKKSLPQKTLKTSYFCSKVYSNEYYVSGVDILNDANRELQVGTRATLLSPVTKSVLMEDADVYKATVGTVEFFYAVAVIGETKLLYFMSKEDFIIAYYTSETRDFYLNSLAEKQLLINSDEFINKSVDCKYSTDGLVRGYSCAIGDKFAVKIEFLDFSVVEGVAISDNEFESFLTDGFLLSHSNKTMWSILTTELFDKDELCEEFLQKIISEISYDRLLATRFGVQ